MEIIKILNLKLPARHGVYDFEKVKQDIFEIDIDMYLDLKNAMISDDISYVSKHLQNLFLMLEKMMI